MRSYGGGVVVLGILLGGCAFFSQERCLTILPPPLPEEWVGTGEIHWKLEAWSPQGLMVQVDLREGGGAEILWEKSAPGVFLIVPRRGGRALKPAGTLFYPLKPPSTLKPTWSEGWLGFQLVRRLQGGRPLDTLDLEDLEDWYTELSPGDPWIRNGDFFLEALDRGEGEKIRKSTREVWVEPPPGRWISENPFEPAVTRPGYRPLPLGLSAYYSNGLWWAVWVPEEGPATSSLLPSQRAATKR